MADNGKHRAERPQHALEEWEYLGDLGDTESWHFPILEIVLVAAGLGIGIWVGWELMKAISG